MSSGKLIVVEGIDGSGKTTAIRAVLQHLENHGKTVVRTKEPGGTTLGARIRRVMYEDVPTTQMAPNVVDMLFLASHVQNARTVVEPALARGEWVVSDRWWYSQLCYAKLREVHPAVMTAYEAVRGPRADLAILLVGDPAILVGRARMRETETHQASKAWNDVATLSKIQEHYLALSRKYEEFEVIWIDYMGIAEVEAATVRVMNERGLS